MEKLKDALELGINSGNPEFVLFSSWSSWFGEQVGWLSVFGCLLFILTWSNQINTGCCCCCFSDFFPAKVNFFFFSEFGQKSFIKLLCNISTTFQCLSSSILKIQILWNFQEASSLTSLPKILEIFEQGRF